jgi:hypothetical protein
MGSDAYPSPFVSLIEIVKTGKKSCSRRDQNQLWVREDIIFHLRNR